MATAERVRTKVILETGPIAVYAGVGAVIQASRRTRPYWFDGRFLAASGMVRDQNFFLHRQRSLGRAAGAGVIHGLLVEQSTTGDQLVDSETLIVGAGHGLTSGGQMVMLAGDLTLRISDLADEEALDVQFGLATTPTQIARTRSGLFILALRPVEFSANPISSYPTSLQGSPITQDGDVVEAAAVSLVPFAQPVSNYDATTRSAAAARQIFVLGDNVAASDSLLPLAMVSIQRGVIEWVQPYLVRRDSATEFAGLRFGLPDPSAEQAFLLQYDDQLVQAVGVFGTADQPARFAATDYFQALPPAGRFPIASIDVNALTHLFFPQAADVTLALIAEDEIPAAMEDSFSLAPIDLTLAASAYADLAIFMLIPISRSFYASMSATLQPTPLSAALPQVIANRAGTSLLRFYKGAATAATNTGTGWNQAIDGLSYGYFIRRRSAPIFDTPVTFFATVTTLTSEGSDVAGLTLTATVSPSAVTGVVTFNDGTTLVGTATLTGGVATLTPPPLAAGSHAFTVTYPGDANYSGSASGPLHITLTAD